MKLAASETEIQKAICDYLAMRHWFFWRNNNQPIYDAKQGRFRSLPKYGMKGRPDIELIKDGMYIAFEVKAERGSQSKEQKEFQLKCNYNGAQYYVVRGIQDVVELGF